MSRDLSIRRLPAAFVCGLIVTIAAGGRPVPAVQAPSAKPLSSMSEKELFRRADASYQAKQLEEARQALILGLAKRKKPDKKYTPLLEVINNELSDREAAKGEAALGSKDLETSQKFLAAAKTYATTQRAQRLEAQLSQTIKEVDGKFGAAVRQSDAGEPESALAQLESLKPFAGHLPRLQAEIGRARELQRQKLVSEGHALIMQRKWEDASFRFQRALTLAKDDEGARAGLEKVERGRRAYQSYGLALEQNAAKNYREATRALQAAMATYPEDKTFERMKEQIKPQWLQQLLGDVPRLLTYPNDFRSTRDAYLRLEQARELDSTNPEIGKYLPQASELLGANSLQRSVELEGIVDYSRVATAAALRMSAQQRMPAGTVKAEELKNLTAVFNRKRTSQVLLAVDNLCAASTAFIQTLQARTRYTLENLGLPDVRIRTIEDYQKSPNEDTQFQEQRPDGKSPTVQLLIGASRYLSERHSSDKPIEMKSQYVSGTERVSNPDYQQLQAEVDRIRKALDARKKRDKPTPEGWTELIYQQKLTELNGIERSINRDKITGYTYQKVEHKQQTAIEVTVTLRDYFSRDALAADTVSFHDEREAVEIDGVRPQDVTGVQNQPVRLPSTEQVLREAERTVLDQLEKKIRALLPTYTSRFYNEAEKALKSGQVEDAVEYYLCHWVFFRGKLDPAQTERIADIVKRETGFDLYKQGGYLLSMSIASAPAMQ